MCDGHAPREGRALATVAARRTACRVAGHMSKRTLRCVAPPPPEPGQLSGAFACYFPAGAPRGAVDFTAGRGSTTRTRHQVMLQGRTVRQPLSVTRVHAPPGAARWLVSLCLTETRCTGVGDADGGQHGG